MPPASKAILYAPPPEIAEECAGMASCCIRLLSYGGIFLFAQSSGMSSRLHDLSRVAAFMLAMVAASTIHGQDSLVAFGTVFNNGILAAGTSPIGAAMGSSIVATGSYNLTFTKTGAFVGTTADDYLVETTVSSVNHGDSVCNASILDITDDVLTVRVRVMDLEDAALPALAAAVNGEFMFVVRRIDGLTSGAPFGSRHLVAAGNVRSTGALDSGFALNGVAIFTGRGDVGEYFVNLFKTGAFTTDFNDDYVIVVSPRNVGTPDVAVRAGAFNATSDDIATFYVRSDDVQSSAPSNTPVKADTAFAFAIYRLGSEDATGSPSSTLLAAVASVDGMSGTLDAGQAAFPGAVVSSTRGSTGRYNVFVDAPGAFAGDVPEQYAALVTLNSSGQIDELAKTRVAIVDENRLRIDVNIDDVEHDTSDEGTPEDTSFFVTVFDTAPLLRHDLRVGPKANGAKSKGAGVFNASGAGQSIKMTLPGVSTRPAFYRSQNSGASVDGLHLRSGKVSRSLKTALFITSTPRRNVTAAARKGALVAEDLRPGKLVTLQATIRYRKLTKRPKSALLLRTLSELQPTGQDASKVFVKPG